MAEQHTIEQLEAMPDGELAALAPFAAMDRPGCDRPEPGSKSTEQTINWRYYPDDCPDCGGDLEVFTESDTDGFIYDNDPVRCRDCGATGIMEIWGDDGDDVRIQWHESAGGASK